MNYFTLFFALVIGSCCFWISFRLIRLFLKVQKWDRVEANILSKEIFLRPKYSTRRTPYGIKIEYEFHFNGRKYTGNKMTLPELLGGQVNYMQKDAEKRVHKIEPTPKVYVNPNNPDESVLYCKGIGFYLIIFCMGILSCLIGLSALVS
jgi:hypothetical protein